MDKHASLIQLFRHGAPSVDAATRFFGSQNMPLVEPGWATFAWIGEADKVELLRWIHGGADRVALERVAGLPLWLLRLPVEDGGRFEYKFAVHAGGHENWVVDPLNSFTAADPHGRNSVCKTFGYSRPDWSRPMGAASGHLEPLMVVSAVFEETRREHVYMPAGYDSENHRYPLLVVHDGSDFVNYADLALCLDNLIARGDIPPLLAVLVQTSDRMEEYPRARRHARYLVQELVPAVETRFLVASEPANRVLLGASLGAVASLSTVFRYPRAFGGAVLMSGSFIVDDAALDARQLPVFERIAKLVKAILRAGISEPLRVFVSTGELEGLADENRELARRLQGMGMQVNFESAWDGHHWHNWRDQLRSGLMWVLSR